MKIKIRGRLGNEQGSVIAVVAIAMIAFIALLAFVIDLAHMHTVRQELQNAAEAGALAGARALFSMPGDSLGKVYPDCTRGRQAARDAAKANKSDGDSRIMLDADAELIRWDWKDNERKPTTPSCNLEAATGVNGIRVTTRRDSTVESKSVFLTFGNIFGEILGKDTMDVVASATAAVGFPGGAAPGTIFPVAITQYMAQNQPPNIPFKIGSAYHYPVSEAGQWTSMLQDFNDVPGIRNLMANGNPDPISVGQTIHIQPGTKNTLYDYVPVGPTPVYLAVVSNLEPNSSAPVVGFLAFVITGSVGGSDKYIEGYFVTGQILPGSTPGGNIFTGTFTPPKLVQ
jgi:Flp pilus assembly protein TadG